MSAAPSVAPAVTRPFASTVTRSNMPAVPTLASVVAMVPLPVPVTSPVSVSVPVPTAVPVLAITNAVVARRVELSPTGGVGALGVPVSVGLASGASTVVSAATVSPLRTSPAPSGMASSTCATVAVTLLPLWSSMMSSVRLTEVAAGNCCTVGIGSPDTEVRRRRPHPGPLPQAGEGEASGDSGFSPSPACGRGWREAPGCGCSYAPTRIGLPFWSVTTRRHRWSARRPAVRPPPSPAPAAARCARWCARSACSASTCTE